VSKGWKTLYPQDTKKGGGEVELTDLNINKGSGFSAGYGREEESQKRSHRSTPTAEEYDRTTGEKIQTRKRLRIQGRRWKEKRPPKSVSGSQRQIHFDSVKD